MAINLKTKTKVKEETVNAPKVDIEPSEMSDEDLADLYGTLQDRAAALMADPTFVRLKEAEDELKARVKDVDPEVGLEIKGKHWLIEMGACSKTPRKVEAPDKVMSFLGATTFYKIAKVTVGDAEKYLTPEQLAAVLSPDVGYTKNRKTTAKFLG